MTLKELLEKLKAFDCAALNEIEVSHYFATKGEYGYEEIVEDVMFDTNRKHIVLICKDQEQCLLESKTMVKYEKMEEKLKYLRLLFIAWFILVIIMSIIKCC